MRARAVLTPAPAPHHLHAPPPPPPSLRRIPSPSPPSLALHSFDVGATPRIYRVLTSTVEAGGFVRVHGDGIYGGLVGDEKMKAILYRGDKPVLGACGEKDCQASNMGLETISCAAREDAGGDAVSPSRSSLTPALAYTDAQHFGCQSGAIPGGLTGGLFNLSLHLSDDYHRGDVFKGYSTTRRVDVALGGVFDTELPPRITSVSPRTGSLGGGTDLTIEGVGFGSDAAQLRVLAGDEPCAITSVTESAIHCRLASLSSTAAAQKLSTPPTPTSSLGLLASHPGERGARWQWSSSGSMLLPSFEAPWTATSASAQVIEGWFEAPFSGTVSFLLRRDTVATLKWSGSATAAASVTLASVTRGMLSSGQRACQAS